MTTPPGVPGVRHAIPKPFRRPSIELDEAHRAWRHVPIGTLHEGDIVAGEGRVNSIKLVTLAGAAKDSVSVITLGDDPHERYGDASRVVHAFTRVRDGD